MAIAAEREDMVLVRRSRSQQQDAEQRMNIERGLREREVHVPERNWYSETRSRFKPEEGEGFQALMRRVEAGRVNRIFIESQDRFGAGRGSKKLFTVLDKLRSHGTKLIDLKTGSDLTSDDMATELTAYVQAKKDELELLDTTYRSLRSKVGRLMSLGAWVGGPPPLGFDKAHHHEDGRLLWVFHHTRIDKGDQFYPGPDGKLTPGPTNVNPPRNDTRMYSKLTPDPTRADMIRDIFTWWTTEQISLRQIALRLNARGDKMYTSPWKHGNVKTVLTNPAYMGAVSYGRNPRAELQTFDKTGKVTQITADAPPPTKRAWEDCPHKEGAHPAIVEKKVWDKAQQKLAGSRKEYPAREAVYWLKGVLVCGHCGRPMTPSSDKKSVKKGGKVYRKYICASYIRGQATGETQDKCRSYQISVEAADKLVEDKLKELGRAVVLDEDGRAKLERETELLGDQADELREQVSGILEAGLQEYVEELRTVYGMADADLEALTWAADIAVLNPPEVAARVAIEGPTGTLLVADVRKAIEDVERRRVTLASAKVAELEGQHTALTIQWAKATDRMQAALKVELLRLESELATWEARAVPLTERIQDYDRQIAERVERMAEIANRWPEMELRQKAEAVRGIIARVILRWRAEPKARITRYPLDSEAIRWEFAGSTNGFGVDTPGPFVFNGGDPQSDEGC